MSADDPAVILVHDWNCQCSACGYGGTSWAASPALQGKEIITQDSTHCPGCGVEFTGRRLSESARQPAAGYRGDSL